MRQVGHLPEEKYTVCAKFSVY